MKKSDLTRLKIEEHAEQLFSERGLAGTSLRAIADSVEIKAGTILHHYPGGKDEIFNRLVQSIFDQLIGELADLEMSGEQLIDSVMILSSSLWDYFDNNPRRAKIIIREAMEENSEAFNLGKFQAKMINKAAKAMLDDIAEFEASPIEDAEVFIFSVLSAVLLYHSAPALLDIIFDDKKAVDNKQRFMSYVESLLSE